MATAAVQRVREYETIYVLSPTVQKEAADKVASRVSEVMGREGGLLTLVENWGRRQLAYPVSKHRRGVYVYLKYTGGGAVVDELERNFRMLDEVLKFQTVKVREDLDPASVEVDADAVKFESPEPIMEEDEEQSLEQQLGLAEPAPHASVKAEPSGDAENAGAAGAPQAGAAQEGAAQEGAAQASTKDATKEEDEK